MENRSQLFTALLTSIWRVHCSKSWKLLEAIVVLPGTLVPRATKATAVTASLRPTVQPKWDATSPMMAVRQPIPHIEITKHK